MDALAGTWKLRSYTLIRADGTIEYPMGKSASGYIMYDGRGYVSVAIMAEDRGDRRGDSPAYLSYAGRYAAKEGVVRHTVEICNLPHWIGIEQVRRFEIKGGTLTLRGGIPGSQSTAQVEWMRA